MTRANAMLQGRAFAPMQSRAHQAELRVTDDRAELYGPDGTQLTGFARADLRFEPRLGSAPRRATFPDGTLFETEDHTGVAVVTGGSRVTDLHGWEAFRPRLLLVVVGIVGAGWLIWRYGLDLIAAVAVAMTPPALVTAIDQGALQTIDFALAEPSVRPVDEHREAEAVLAALLAALPTDEREAHAFRLEFRAIPGLGPNAIALPGGTIVVTDDFLRLFPSSDIRAGVLAHEIGHITEQHGLRQLYRSLGIAVLIALLAGDTVPIVEDIVLEGNLLLSLSFSRKAERAADQFGVGLSRRAGFDPAGLVAFFDWVHDEFGDSSGWLSTHPSSTERMEVLRQLIDGG